MPPFPVVGLKSNRSHKPSKKKSVVARHLTDFLGVYISKHVQAIVTGSKINCPVFKANTLRFSARYKFVLGIESWKPPQRTRYYSQINRTSMRVLRMLGEISKRE